jgi:hypothetical protein
VRAVACLDDRLCAGDRHEGKGGDKGEEVPHDRLSVTEPGSGRKRRPSPSNTSPTALCSPALQEWTNIDAAWRTGHNDIAPGEAWRWGTG